MYCDMTTKQSHASRYADEMSRCAARHACRCSQRGSGSCKLVYARSKQRSMTNRPTARDRQNSTERPRRILTERQQHHRRTNRGWDQCLSQAFPPRKKNLQSTLKRLPNCVLEMFFFGRDNELQTHRGNFLFTDNKHRNLFVIKQSKRCKFVPKMRQNALGGRAPRGPTRGAYALPQTS